MSRTAAQHARWVLTAFFLIATVAVAQPEKKDGKPNKKDNAAGEPNNRLRERNDWGAVEGPTTGKLGTIAEIKVPAGMKFLGQPGAAKFAEETHNLGGEKWLGVLFLKGSFIVFTFDAVGYIKDADKEKLDADALMKSLKEGEEQSNEEYKKRGWAPVTLDGWEQPPAYDPTTNNLVWAIRVTGGGSTSINYETRILGRSGVMQMALVGNREEVRRNTPAVNELLKGFEFVSGNKYAEWKPGDKVAQYGLAALIAGGGVALAAKAGLLAKFGVFIAKFAKVILIGVVAVGAAISRFFGAIFGRRKREVDDRL